jgi:hypothetical protein
MKFVAKIMGFALLGVVFFSNNVNPLNVSGEVECLEKYVDCMVDCRPPLVPCQIECVDQYMGCLRNCTDIN